MSISKTKYFRGIGCERVLWLDEHKPEVAEAPEDKTKIEQETLNYASVT